MSKIIAMRSPISSRLWNNWRRMILPNAISASWTSMASTKEPISWPNAKLSPTVNSAWAAFTFDKSLNTCFTNAVIRPITNSAKGVAWCSTSMRSTNTLAKVFAGYKEAKDGKDASFAVRKSWPMTPSGFSMRTNAPVYLNLLLRKLPKMSPKKGKLMTDLDSFLIFLFFLSFIQNTKH